MKKIKIILLAFGILVLGTIPADAISVSAQFSCVMEAETGQVLYEKNAYSQHSMASTTKIMTALLAIEKGNLSDVVTVSKNAVGTEGTSLYLQAGDKVTLSDLLYGLLLQSGNDAAIAIAEHISGSVEQFAEDMTVRAKEIGANSTAFQNPNGLDAEGHYTTAYDLALITREALKNKTFSEIAATKSKTIQDGKQTVVNHNKLLNLYPGCVGVKTGFTKKTGRCLVSSAVRDGKQFICVTLNAPDDWNDHTRLLDYAFSETIRYPLIAKGMTVNSVTVKNGKTSSVELTAKEDFYVTATKTNPFDGVDIRLQIPDSFTAPVQKETAAGYANIYRNDILLGQIPLETAADIEIKATDDGKEFWKYFKKLWYFGCV